MAVREPAPPPWADTSWDANRSEFDARSVRTVLFLAEEDGEVVGFVSSWLEEHLARIGDVYVARGSAGEGVGARARRGRDRERASPGRTHLILNANLEALPFYDRLGFREESRNLVLPLEVRSVGSGRSFGSIHVQTDDIGAVERAVRQFVPRLPGGSHGSRCAAAARLDRRLRRRLRPRPVVAAAAGAGALGADGRGRMAVGVEHEQVVRFILFEAGRIVDEYLSVPEYYGTLPPGDVIALAANPRVVARLTGADPAEIPRRRADGRVPGELPPPQELLADRGRDRARGRGAGVGRA